MLHNPTQIQINKYKIDRIMHSKIYKAKLLSVHGQAKVEPPSLQSNPIHTYFGMLQHIFQRNRHMIRQLKLSGTRIQQPNATIVRGRATQQYPSESTRRPKTDIKLTEHSQHMRSLTSERNTGTLSNSRHLITHNRYRQQNKSLQHCQEKYIQQICNFVPIGQASQQRLQLPRKTSNTKEQNKCKINEINIKLQLNSSKNYLRQSQTQRKVSLEKKQSLRTNRGQIRSKTQQPEEVTTYSSIRSSQKSNYEIQSCMKLVPLQSVTPW